jgi:cyclopropane fatty-acyl-phospholipid synthase-like methyltransferase
MTMPWIDYDQHARTRPKCDLWGQVRRTIHGVPVGPEQIDMIVTAIRDQLDLQPTDTLIDLGCGNGALTSRLFSYVAASHGVDLSNYMVEIAQHRFSTSLHNFQADDAVGFTETERAPERFTKALCYGTVSYLDDDQVRKLLRNLFARFPRVSRILLGNLPDPERAADFYTDIPLPDLLQPRSALGVWRSAQTLAALAGPGWDLVTTNMPDRFFAAHYRYDAILVRAP